MVVNTLDQLYNAVKNDESIITLKNDAKRIVESNMTERYDQFRQCAYYKPCEVSLLGAILSLFDKKDEKRDLENKKIEEICNIIGEHYSRSGKGHSYIELRHNGELSINVEDVKMFR